MKLKRVILTMIGTVLLFTGGNFFVGSADAATNNVKYSDYSGCNPSQEKIKYYKNNFKEELKKRGVKESIKVKGKTLKINANFTVENCLPLYGGVNDIPKSGKMKQRYDDQKRPKYLGYDQYGNYVQSVDYNELGTIGDESKFVNTRKFVANPWNHSALKKSITSTNSKPYVKSPQDSEKKKKTNKSRTTLLNTAVDHFYLGFGKDPHKNLGPRGYFPKVNSAIGTNLNGTNLSKYASVEFYPEDYSFGLFHMYHECYYGYCYSAYLMPALKNIFDDNPDIAVTGLTASNSSPWEGDTIKLTYTIKNVGDVNIVNPQTQLTFAGNKINYTFKGTLKEGQSKSHTVEVRTPQVTKDTKETAKVVVNPTGKNPMFEVNTKDNSKETDVTVKNITRDLSVAAIEIDGNQYFDGNTDTINTKLFEGEEVVFRYKLKFDSNKSSERLVNPVVKFGKEGGITKEEQLIRTLKSGETTGWIKASFNYSK